MAIVSKQVSQPQHVNPLMRLVNDFIALNTSRDFRSIWVILPNQRLGVYFLAMLGERLGAFLPPKILTLETFLDKAGDGKLIIDPISYEVILAEEINRTGFRTIRSGDEREACLLFESLFEWGIEDTAFESFERAITEDVYSTDGRTSYALERNKELATLFSVFRQHLTLSKESTHQEYYRRCALVYLEQLQDSVPWKHLWIGCITTVKGFLHPLFQKLSTLPCVRFYLSNPPKLYTSRNPLEEIYDDLGKKIQDKESQTSPTPRIVSLPSPAVEAAYAVHLAHEYIQKSYPPSSIGIIVTSENQYRSLLEMFLGLKGINANLALPRPITSTRIGLWLSNLAGLILGGQKSEDLEVLKAHPWYPFNPQLTLELFCGTQRRSLLDWTEVLKSSLGNLFEEFQHLD